MSDVTMHSLVSYSHQHGQSNQSKPNQSLLTFDTFGNVTNNISFKAITLTEL